MPASERLQQLLEAGDEAGCIKFFTGMPESERRALADQCAAWHKRVLQEAWIRLTETSVIANPQLAAAGAAMFCTGTFSELTKIPIWSTPGDDVVYQTLADRKPQWLGQWIQQRLDDAEFYWLGWKTTRRLVREGLVEKPEHPNYALGMISGIRSRLDQGSTVEAALLADPELLDDEIWRLFELEGGGQNSLANVDRFGDGMWSKAMLSFATDGRLPRSRLLSSCLAALGRDFNHYRAKWFANLYDALAPTAAELRADADSFLRLLDVSAPNIVSWAFKKVQKQAKAGAYPAKQLVERVQPTVNAQAKGLCKNALKLLAQTATSEPSLGDRIARMAAQALTHEAVDVQETALTTIEAAQAGRSTDENPDLVDELVRFRELVAPSLRNRLNALLGTDPAGAESSSEAVHPRGDTTTAPIDLSAFDPTLATRFGLDAFPVQPTDGIWTLPAATFDGTELAQLHRRETLEPIEGLDELIEVAARVLEDSTGADDVERVFDGLSRLCAERPADFDRRTAPLFERAKQRMKQGLTPFAGEGPASDLCGLLRAWISGEVPQTSHSVNEHDNECVFVVYGDEQYSQFTANLRRVLGVFSRRALALAHRLAAGQPTPLLSAPTHAGGWIDPVILAERIPSALEVEPDRIDVGLAMLRLAPERRTEAAAAIDRIERAGDDPEWLRAVGYALGEELAVGESAALWITAARARFPWAANREVARAFPEFGVDTGTPPEESVVLTEVDGHLRIQLTSTDSDLDQELDCLPFALHRERKAPDSRYLLFMSELGGVGGRTGHSVRWTATAWPLARESLFAAALEQLHNNRDWHETQWQNQALLEPLLDPGTPLREMGLLLLVLGLGAKEPGESGLATDAAIAAIEDGRLGSDNLGRALRFYLVATKPGRWAKTLANVANASPAHAGVVKLALEQCLAVLADPPRDFAKLLELLFELCVSLEVGIAPDQRIHLEGIQGSSKLAKTAKALLSVTDPSEAAMRAAVAQWSELRIAAAAAWQPATGIETEPPG